MRLEQQLQLATSVIAPTLNPAIGPKFVIFDRQANFPKTSHCEISHAFIPSRSLCLLKFEEHTS
jgi:hypothetical protein